MYGFPAIDGKNGGFKMGTAGFNKVVTVDTIDRNVTEEEALNCYKQQVLPFFPEAVGQAIKSKVCLYTVTSDAGFVIDRLPDMPNVLLCSPCSGHGFKHTAAIGESIAEVIFDGKSKLDLSHFKLDRLLVSA
jgi:sarcosine oxidase